MRQLLLEGAAGLAQMALDRLQQSLAAQPEDEPRLRVVLRQACGRKGDGEDGDPDARAARAQRTGRSEPATELLAAGLEFAELRADLVGQVDETAGTGPVGEDAVRPQGLEHPDQVRLPASVEAADPHRGLRRLVEIGEVAPQDPIQTRRVLALGDEGVELVPEDRPFLVRPRLADLGHAEVRDQPGRGIAGQDVTNQRHREAPSGMVIGMAR